MKLMEKPELDENLLVHYGVKGMQWGVRSARSTSTEIHNARVRQFHRMNMIVNQDRVISLARSGKAHADAIRKQDKLVRAFATSEDRVTAARITGGEKAAHLILLGPLALVTLSLKSSRAKAIARATDKARLTK